MREPQSHKNAAKLPLGHHSSYLRIDRQPLPGYKNIKRCEKLMRAANGSIKVLEVFYEVYHSTAGSSDRSKRRKTEWDAVEDAIAASREGQTGHAVATHAAAGLFEQVSHLSLVARSAAVAALGKPSLRNEATPPSRKEYSNAGDNSSYRAAQSKAAAPQQQQQQQQQKSDLLTTASQLSHAGGQFRTVSDEYDATFMLRPEQHVQLQMLQHASGLLGYSKTQCVLQLRVLGLLGAGGLNEVHEAELLPAGGAAPAVLDSSAAAAAADLTTGDSIGSSRRLAFKVPLRYTSPLVPEASRECCPMRDDYYQNCQRLLLKEASIMRQLAGWPGITSCYGVGESSFTTSCGICYEGVCGLLLELAELGDLQQQLTPAPGEVAPMDSKQAWRVMVAAARALHSVHSVAGCVYEDLKPSNIVCTKGTSGETEYKLIDFSSCIKLHNGRAPARVVGGTRGFMSPEAAAGEEHSVTADTWSLAALLLALKTGHPPWHHLASLELPADAAAGRRTFEELLQVPLYQQAFGAREWDFLKTALDPDWQQRPTAQQLLESEPYMRYGPGDDAATAEHMRDTAAYAAAGRGLLQA